MKKFLAVFFWALCVLPGYAQFEKGCGIKGIVLAGIQNKSDNEFLYENKATYDAFPNKNGTYENLPGRVWECDNEYCTNHKVVEVPAGHYYNGQKQAKANWYKCRDDKWYPFACGEGYIGFKGGQKAHHDEFLYTNEAAYKEAKAASDKGQDGVDVESGLVYECDNQHCLGRSLKKMPAGHYFNGQRIDKAVEYKLGARGLRSIMESIMIDAMYEVPSKKQKTYKVSLSYAKKQLEKANLIGS